MLTGFAHAELASILWPVTAIAPAVLTAGNSLNTYGASPQPAAGIDTWDGGVALYNNLLLVVDVTSLTAGHLDISMWDSADAITTANGAASTTQVASLPNIAAAGLYYAEFMFTHVFADTTARVVADADNIAVRRYHSFRATATGGDATFGVLAIYGFTSRNYPVQKATKLDITWVST